MSSRFEEASAEAVKLVNNVIRDNEEFASLVNVPLAVLFDLKKRESGSGVVFARIQTVAEAMKVLTASDLNDHDGWAYVMYLDKAVFIRANEDLRRALIAHELRHCLVDETKDGEPVYKLIGHDIELFHNDLDHGLLPRWPDQLGDIWRTAYDDKGNPKPYDPDQGDLFDDGKVVELKRQAG